LAISSELREWSEEKYELLEKGGRFVITPDRDRVGIGGEMTNASTETDNKVE